MKNLIKSVLDRPVAVIVTIIALVVFFANAMISITLKYLPNMSVPMMAVVTPYPGATPEDVDELVTEKIDSAVESLAGLKMTQCESTEGQSVVFMQFEYGKDMDKAYNEVKEAVDQKKASFPSGVKDYTIYEMDTNAADDITLSVTGTSDNIDVRAEVDQNILPELKKVSTLAQAKASGGDEKYIRVQVNPEYMSQYGLTIPGIASAIGAVNFSTPAGNADYGDQSIPLSAQVKYDNISLIEQIPITTSKGQVIHLNDVAKVSYGVSDKNELSRYMGKSNVSIGLKRKQSASAVTLSRQVKPVLEKLREKNPQLEIVVVDDSADTILKTLKSVGVTVVEAILLAMFIIFIFFGDIKGSLIVGSTMPISIMATVVCMHLAGLALDIVTMAALIIAIGMMTDNAVVVIEMCFRKHQAGLSFKDAAFEGTSVVVNAVIGSTLTTVIVYVPLSVMKGLSGQMFKPLGFTIIFALLASLFAAITLIPLCFASYKPVERREIITNRILKWLSKRYVRVLRFALKWKKSVLLVAILMLALTGFLATFLKMELMSGTDEGIVNVTVKFRPNLDIDAMDDTVAQIEKYIADSGVIKNYSTAIEKTYSQASISAYRSDDADLSTQDIVDNWNVELQDFSNNCDVEVAAGSTMGMGSISQVSTQEFDIASADMDKLKAKSKEIVQILKDTDGVLFVKSDFSDAGAKAMVDIDPVMASAKGFSAKELANLVYNNMAGSKGTEVTIDKKKYDVTVKFPDDYYKSISDVESMTFTNSKGVSVPLSEVGRVKFESAPESLKRQDGFYGDQIIATMTAETRDDIAEVLQKEVDEVMTDPDVFILEDAMSEMMNEEFTALAKAIFIAIFLVFFIMAVQFESVVNALLIMLCVPFAGVGSILFLLAMNIKLSMVSLMGVLMLAGIVVNNGIILIDMTIQNQKAGMETAEALVDAGKGRLRPILMTTLTTVMAMIPVALGMSKDAMVMQGMAAVIVGGLAASTVLTLILLPTFYLLLDTRRAKVTAKQAKRRKKLEQKVVDQEKMFLEREKANAKVNLVFPMGGAGTRFSEEGFECPKPLIELEGEPFFKRAVDSLVGHVRVERLIFVVLREHIDKFQIDEKIHEYYPEARIVTLPKVLPGAVMTAMEGAKVIHNDLPVIFTDCDLLFTSQAMYDFYGSGAFGADATLLTFKSDKDIYSYVKLKEDGYAEKTAEKEVISDTAITGSYGFSSASLFLDMAHRYIKNCPYNEFYMSGIFNEIISIGRKVKVFGVDEYMSFGTPEELEKAKEMLKKKLEEPEGDGAEGSEEAEEATGSEGSGETKETAETAETEETAETANTEGSAEAEDKEAEDTKQD